jgi:hypothetical protein
MDLNGQLLFPASIASSIEKEIKMLMGRKEGHRTGRIGWRTSLDQSASANTAQLPASSSAAILSHRAAFVAASGWWQAPFQSTPTASSLKPNRLHETNPVHHSL